MGVESGSTGKLRRKKSVSDRRREKFKGFSTSKQEIGRGESEKEESGGLSFFPFPRFVGRMMSAENDEGVLLYVSDGWRCKEAREPTPESTNAANQQAPYSCKCLRFANRLVCLYQNNICFRNKHYNLSKY